MKSSFSKKIMLTTSVVVLVLAVILSIASWILSSRSFYAIERDLLSKNVDSAHRQLSDLLENAQELTTRLVQTESLRTLIHADDPAVPSLAYHVASLRRITYGLITSGDDWQSEAVAFLGIYLKNGYTLTTLSEGDLPYHNLSDCITALNNSGITDIEGYMPMVWFDRITLHGSPAVPCLVGIRFLYEDVTLEKAGAIVIGIQQPALTRTFSSVSEGMYLIREDGTILISSDRNAPGSILAYADEMISHVKSGGSSPIASLPDGSEAFVYRIAGGASWLVSPIERDTLLHSGTFYDYMRHIIYLIALAVLFTILLSYFISKHLTRSLTGLTDTVKEIRDGRLDERIIPDSKDEIGYLGEKINEMLDEINGFYRAREADAAEKQYLNLQLLQAQINPHLLYNTLNSACWIIRQNDNEKAEKLILSLGNFFKLALSRGSEEISLENEISMIRYYLQVQNLGRGKDYKLEEAIPDMLRTQKILRLSLQPIVENAVIHGFSDWRDDGSVSISASLNKDGKSFTVTVLDNGIGILPEDLAPLSAAILSGEPGTKAHYGLLNVVRRIRGRYGSAYGMTITSEVGEYTRCDLTFPYTPAPDTASVRDASHPENNGRVLPHGLEKEA